MTKKLNPVLEKIIIILGIMFLLSLVICFALEAAKNKKTAKEAQERNQAVLKIYQQKISQQNDSYALTKTGLRQLNINLPELALVTLKRAVEVKSDYRDARLALGLAELKNNNIQDALFTFQKAAELDPIYAKTFELLKVTYERLNNKDGAGEAETKYRFLTKS